MKSERKKSSRIASDMGMGCCQVEAVVSIDERGQMVLPKEVREKANIRAGDKMAVITWGQGETSCCICLIKTEEFTQMLKGVLGPMFKEIIQ